MVTRRSTDPMRALGQLTDRDHIILGWLYDHRILTTDQIATALFPSLDSAQERLRTLFLLGLLDRGRMFREGGGKHSWRYMLDHDGWAIVAAHRGDGPPPRRDKIRARNLHLVQSAKTAHLLGVNGFFTALAGNARSRPGTVLERWWSERQTETVRSIERVLGPRVRPDGHGIFTADGRTVSFFLEHDTGSEPLQTLVDKLDGYAHLHRTGLHWPVLFWLPSTIRELNLHRRIGHRKDVLVATAAVDGLWPGTGPADAVWQIHGEDSGHRFRLVDLPSSERPTT
jgi:hypothetical protein